MIIYRPHKGGLAESLAEAKEFQSEDEMKEYIVQDYKKLYADMGYKEPPFEVDDIVIKDESCNDTRCGWHDSRYVCVKRLGKEDYIAKYGTPQCIGMCAVDYEAHAV